MNRIISIQKGLEPPEHEAHLFGCCTCETHIKSPSITEMALAAKPHRWKDMREEHKAAFTDYMGLVTAKEIDMLALLRLPQIDSVRSHVLEGSGRQVGAFEFTDRMRSGLRRIFDEWIVDLFGTEKKVVGRKADDEMPLFRHHSDRAFVIGVDHTKKDIVDGLPEGYPADLVVGIMADPEEHYYKAMLETAAKRIKTQVAKDNLKQVISALIDMANNGEYPINVARYLHKKVGEGASWYWLRIARSEAVLASNAAHNAMAEKNKTNFEKWSAAPSACPICMHFAGKTWRRGEGPEPVSSTHPHCCCTRIPLYSWDGTIQERHTRDPYTDRYTRNEIEEFLNERHG
jgi:hypothetical protein